LFALQVATAEDPATARLNESVYRFVQRSAAGSLADAIDMELTRLQRCSMPFFGLHNK
jgi:alkane 1-monooxygenase